MFCSVLFCSVLFFAEVISNNHIWKPIRRGISWGWLHSESFVWECVGGWDGEARGNPGYWKSPQEVRLRQEN